MFFCKWFKKKESLKFITKIDAAKDLMPPVRSKSVQVPWKVDQAKAYNNFLKSNFVDSKHRFTFRCPGMTNMHNTGWIIKTWQDCTIQTNGDSKLFYWTTAHDQKLLSGEDFIGSHESEFFADIVSKFPKNTLQTIIKFHTSWRCIIPDGYLLYQLPLNNFTENRFTPVAGVYSYKLKVADINVPVLWHELNSKIFLPAGTPLCQLILVKQEDVEEEIKSLSECNDYEKRILGVYTTSIDSTFLRNYKDTEDIIKNLR